jgi:hypothetical protein
MAYVAQAPRREACHYLHTDQDMRRRIRQIHLVFALVAASPVAGSLAAQQATTGNIVATGIGVAYFALSIGSIVRLVGHSRQAGIGDRVRVRSSSVKGTVTAVDGDSVTVHGDAGDTRLSRSDTRRLRVSEGREHKWAQGWGVGLLAGATVGAVAGAVSKAPADDPNCEFICPTREVDIIFGGLAAGVTGSLVGAAIGAGVVGERWARVSQVVGRTSLRIDRRPGGLAFGGRIEF